MCMLRSKDCIKFCIVRHSFCLYVVILIILPELLQNIILEKQRKNSVDTDIVINICIDNYSDLTLIKFGCLAIRETRLSIALTYTDSRLETLSI